METVNMLRAKSTLSRLVEAVELGQESEPVVARNGRPVAKLVPLDNPTAGTKVGIARGGFEVPDTIDAHNPEVAQLFLGAKR